MVPRSERGYELDVQHLEILSRAVARDVRIPIAGMITIAACVGEISVILRPFLQGAVYKARVSKPQRKAKR
jgi:hypothetical protein